MPDSSSRDGSQTVAYPLRRAAGDLRDRHFDLLVIGGGIYGAWTACDAARRGLSVALVEARDWAAGTSSASSKLIHGGLRYLENLELGLVRESLSERRTLARIAPHHVRPLRFLLPVWDSGRDSLWKLSAGLTLYDLLAGFGQPVGRHRRLPRTRLRTGFPWLAETGLRGAFDYGDCQEDDARLTLDVVAAAQYVGAVCANRVVAETLLEAEGRVRGARLHDDETGERFEILARAVVAAAGPWNADLAGSQAPKIELVRGAHLLLPAIPGCRHAFLLSAPQDGRAFFVIPWYGRSLVGTTESRVEPDQVDDPAFMQATAEERRYLLDAVAARLPGLGWDDSSVIGSFAGARSLVAEDAANLSAVSREFQLLQPRPGLWMPLGGKFTTARHEAEDIVDTVLRALGRHPPPCDTASRPLPGAPSGDFPTWRREWQRQTATTTPLDADVLDSLAHRYGTRASAVIALIEAEPALGERLDGELPFLAAEVVLARRDEMARDLEDVLRRRLPIALLARPGAWRERARAAWETAA